MKMNEAIGVYRGLSALQSREFRSALAFKVARAIKSLEQEAKTFEEAQNKIFSKYGELNQEKTEWVIQKDNIAAMTAERDELLAVECAAQVPAFQEADFDGIEISPAILAQLLPVIAQTA